MHLTCSVAALSYSSSVNFITSFKDSYSGPAISAAIQSSSYLGGPSDVVNALDTISLQLYGRQSSGVRNQNGAIVIVTDGMNDAPLSYVQDASIAIAKNVRQTVAVGVGPKMNPGDLAAIASSPAHVFLGNATSLGRVTVERIAARLGATCALIVTTPATAGAGDGGVVAQTPRGAASTVSSEGGVSTMAIVLGEFMSHFRESISFLLRLLAL